MHDDTHNDMDTHAEDATPQDTPRPTQHFTPNLTELRSSAPTKATIEWENGISFDLTYLPRAEFQRLSKECAVMKYDPKLKARVSTVDGELLIKKFVNRVVRGWDGLTVRKAANIVPLNTEGLTEEQLDTAVVFSQEQMVALLKDSYDLDSFLQDTAMNLAAFNPSHKDEVKN